MTSGCRWLPSLILPLLLLLSGCISNPSKEESASVAEPAQAEPVESAPAISLAPPQQPLAGPETEPESNLWQLLVAGYGLEEIQHAAIEQEIRSFQLRGESLSRQLARGEPFLYHILQELKKRDMPTEIALLPAVESGYRPTAYSRHGAAGLWQFMPATGRYFGLKQDWWYDARRDPLASTDAALDYLEKLHDRFGGDWLLAMAAYNGGGGTVARAMRKNRDAGKPTDFWSLKLPAETRQYVPRILALARIIANPDQYGLHLPEIGNDPRFVKVEIGNQIDLKVAARLAGMEPEALLSLNAGFNRWATHPQGPHYLLLPVEKAAQFSTGLAELPESERLRWTRYRIRRGDTVSGIARKHGVSVSAIMQSNGLRNHRIRAGAELTIPLSASPTLAIDTTSTTRRKLRYQVRKGDSLYRIARQFGVKVVELKKWNQLASNHLRPGQTLTVIRQL